MRGLFEGGVTREIISEKEGGEQGARVRGSRVDQKKGTFRDLVSGKGGRMTYSRDLDFLDVNIVSEMGVKLIPDCRKMRK